LPNLKTFPAMKTQPNLNRQVNYNKMNKNVVTFLLILFCSIQSNLSFSQVKSSAYIDSNESVNDFLILNDSIKKEYMRFANQLLIENTILKVGVVSLNYQIDKTRDNTIFYKPNDLYVIGDSSLSSENYYKLLGLIAWEKDFVDFIPEHPNLSKKEYDLFSFQYLDTLRNVTFEIDGIVYDNVMFINKRKYCLYKNKFSEFNQANYISQLDSIVDTLSVIYPIKITNYHLFGVNAYELSFKDYLKENGYYLTFELAPRDIVFTKKTSRNSIIDVNEYSPLNYCTCDNYDVTLLFESANYKEGDEGFKKYVNKYEDPMDISYQINYLLIRLEDLRIIQHGIESAMKMEYSKYATH